ncbi:MAG: AGE family epimerase/isomerase [Pseudomonadota bacterium]
MPALDDTSRLLQDAAQFSRSWLFDSALPLWWARGADHQGGGFHEQLGLDGQAIGTPFRLRVQARQIFVYARAGALGWNGPWQDAVAHGLEFMLARYARPDGFFRSTPVVSDDAVDLYDQAFVLFALAHAHTARPGDGRLLDVALALMRQIDGRLRVADGPGGYRATLASATGMHANPHMHLLEALFAWMECGVSAPFRQQAAQICDLALSRMIDPAHGGLGEHFGEGWSRPAAAEQCFEPGHQFEWAYLLIKAGKLLDLPAQPEALALERFAHAHGIDAQRGVAIFSVDVSGRTLDARARLWAQTERLRTYSLLLTENIGHPRRAAEELQASMGTLRRFLDVPVTGLWREWMGLSGEFDATPCPASSLYHLMTGMGELVATTPTPPSPPSPPSPVLREKILT